jgi:hypothetical protein
MLTNKITGETRLIVIDNPGIDFLEQIGVTIFT